MGVETVTVCCKLPAGLMLRLFKPVVVQEAVIGGGVRDVTRHEMVGEPIHIKGYNKPTPKKSGGLAAVDGFFEKTPNVPKEFWDEWREQNKDQKVVQDGLIFAYVDRTDGRFMKRDSEKLRSGFEPLDMENLHKDPRIPRETGQRVQTFARED